MQKQKESGISKQLGKVQRDQETNFVNKRNKNISPPHFPQNHMTDYSEDFRQIFSLSDPFGISANLLWVP